jgi:hypothetical protein
LGLKEAQNKKPKDNAKKIKGKRGEVKDFLPEAKNQLIADSPAPARPQVPELIVRHEA